MPSSSPQRSLSRFYPLLAVCLVWAWQAATVQVNFRGNWSALYCTGGLQPQPSLNATEGVYLFPGSHGYDGQFYHYIAHDPWLRLGLDRFIDDPALRYRRILAPLLAHLLALGRPQWIDAAVELVFLAGIAAGVHWSGLLAVSAGLPAAAGLLFLLFPAIPISMDRLVVDSLLAALTVGFLLFSATPSWRTFLLLSAAALTRETGWFLIAGYCAWLALERRWLTACLFLCAALPAAGWYAYVHAHTISQTYEMSLAPFSAIVWAFAHPWPYPAGVPLPRLVQLADLLALSGVVSAFGLSAWMTARSPRHPALLCALGLTLMGVIVQRQDHWRHVYDFGRVYTPLLLCLAALAAWRRNPWLLLPTALMLPRIVIQLTPQTLGLGPFLLP